MMLHVKSYDNRLLCHRVVPKNKKRDIFLKHSVGIHGEGKPMGQPASPGAPEKMVVKMVCVRACLHACAV